MKFKFLPQEFNFFELFNKQVDYAALAAAHLKHITSKDLISQDDISKMQDIEHHGDDAAHSIIDQLNKTFITPFDREDIYALAKELDDITDMINTIASRMMVYKIRGINKDLVEFANVIEESLKSVACAVKGMNDMKNLKTINESCVEINRLENVGDEMRDKALGHLFDTEKDPIQVIKLKEIYQDAETVLDICEDVAHVVESILVKQA